jgi:hypothetical protein
MSYNRLVIRGLGPVVYLSIPALPPYKDTAFRPQSQAFSDLFLKKLSTLCDIGIV